MTDKPTVALPAPVEVIAARLSAACVNESKTQTAFACIGALEQSSWVIVRKRHMRNPK